MRRTFPWCSPESSYAQCSLICMHGMHARTLIISTQPPLLLPPPSHRTLASTQNYSIHLENVPQLLRKMPQMQFNPNGFDTPLLRHYHIHAKMELPFGWYFQFSMVRFNARWFRLNFKNLQKFSWILPKRNRRNDGANWKQCYVDTRLDQHAFARTHTSCRSVCNTYADACLSRGATAASVRHFTNAIARSLTHWNHYHYHYLHYSLIISSCTLENNYKQQQHQ